MCGRPLPDVNRRPVGTPGWSPELPASSPRFHPVALRVSRGRSASPALPSPEVPEQRQRGHREPGFLPARRDSLPRPACGREVGCLELPSPSPPARLGPRPSGTASRRARGPGTHFPRAPSLLCSPGSEGSGQGLLASPRFHPLHAGSTQAGRPVTFRSDPAPAPPQSEPDPASHRVLVRGGPAQRPRPGWKWTSRIHAGVKATNPNLSLGDVRVSAGVQGVGLFLNSISLRKCRAFVLLPPPGTSVSLSG